MSAAALIAHQFRFEQRVFWRSPAAVFFTVMFPRHLPAAVRARSSATEIEGLGIRRGDLLRAGDHHPRRGLRDARERLDADRRDARERPAEAAARDAAADLGLHRRPDRQRVRRLGADGRDRHRCSAACSTASSPDGDDPGAAGDADRRHLRLLLARPRADRAIPSEQAAPPITNFTVLPLYFLSGVFVPESEIPDGVLTFASLFPIRHFFQAFLDGLRPAHPGRRVRLGPPRGGRRLGNRRNPDRSAVLPLVAAPRVSSANGSVVATGQEFPSPA